MEVCPVCGNRISGRTGYLEEDPLEIRGNAKNSYNLLQPDLVPGESIIKEYPASSLPVYLILVTSFVESMYVIIPLLFAIYTQTESLFTLYWIETSLIPAIAVFSSILLVHLLAGRARMKSSKYIITDKRVISLSGRNGRKTKSMDIQDVENMRISRGRVIVNMSFSSSRFISLIQKQMKPDNSSRFAAAGTGNAEVTEDYSVKMQNTGAVSADGNSSLRSGSYVPETRPKVRIRSIRSAYREARNGGTYPMIHFFHITRKNAEDAEKTVTVLKDSLQQDKEET